MTDLLKLLGIHAGLPARTVLKHLRYEPGPHALAKVERKTLIACTSRSGSTLVQECLGRYGLNIEEFFNVGTAVKQASELGVAGTTRQYADFLAQTAVVNGHFAAKGSYVAFLFLYYMGELPRLRSGWRIVYLRRRNLVRQAISMSIVAVTKQWTSERIARNPIRLDDYSFDDIMKRLETILAENQILERIFALLDLVPYRLFYEDFVADIAAQTERIAQFTGVDVSAFPLARHQAPRLKPQSNELNDEWERRFRAELDARLLIDPGSLPTGSGT